MQNILKIFDETGLLAQFQPDPTRVYRIGAARDCDCCDRRLDELQCTVRFANGNWLLENPAATQTFCNDRPVVLRPLLVESPCMLNGLKFRFVPTREFSGSTRKTLQKQIYDELLETLNARENLQTLSPEELEKKIIAVRDEICDAHAGELAAWAPETLREFKDALIEDILKLGPLEPLLADDAITEIMVVDENRIYVEKGGHVTLCDIQFKSVDHLMRIIERIVSPLGRRIDTSSPMVDARLKDGSRVNAIIPPLAADGPCLTIRKFGKKIFNCDMLLRYRSLTPEMVAFIQSCVMARKNIVVSGGTGSGKTSLLNAVSAFISNSERIVTIEDSLELKLQQPHVVRLESRPPNAEGQGAVPIRSLVINSLRMRPDRIVVGECRGGEALDMLQAMNTGHDGSLTTVHANTAADAISRLETLVLMSGMELPLVAIRSQIAAAVDVIIQTCRLSDGSRKIISITEVEGLDANSRPILREIFRFRQTGVDQESKKILGVFEPMAKPSFYEQMRIAGIPIEEAWFTAKN